MDECKLLIIVSVKDLKKNKILTEILQVKCHDREKNIHEEVNRTELDWEEIDYKISSLIDKLIQGEMDIIDKEHQKIKDSYYDKLYTRVIEHKHGYGISLIKRLKEFEKIIAAMYPVYLLDRNTTQEISDNLVDLITKLDQLHCLLVTNQTYLRKQFNSLKIEDKITLDERDIINKSIVNAVIPSARDDILQISHLTQAKEVLDKEIDGGVNDDKEIISEIIQMTRGLSKVIKRIEDKISSEDPNLKKLKDKYRCLQKDLYNFNKDMLEIS